MKLTTQQITTIGETLVLNGLIYDDIKLEVTDHIASEIETKMEESNILFDDALYQVLLNWNEQMKPKYSIWLGTKNIAPKIAVQKMVLDTKKQFLIVFLPLFCLMFLLAILLLNRKNEILIENCRSVLKGVYLIEALLLIGSKYFIWKSKSITSYKYVFTNLNPWALVVLLFFVIGFMPIFPQKADLGIILASGFMASFYLFWPIFYIYLAYKHFQFDKKLKLS